MATAATTHSVPDHFKWQGATSSDATEETHESSNAASTTQAKKPYLPVPESNPRASGSMNGMFIELMKLAIHVQSESYSLSKMDVDAADREHQEFVKEKMEKDKEARAKERSAQRWGVLAKVFAWLGSAISTIIGLGLIVTGIGAPAGALMVAGGALTISSQIMELAGGWQKIAESLPGDDEEKKHSVCSWIQISIGIFALILSGAGMVAGGGMDVLGNTMQLILTSAGAVFQGASATATIGTSVNQFFFKDHMAELEEIRMEIVKNQQHRDRVNDHLSHVVETVFEHFKSIATALQLDEAVFNSQQAMYRR